MTNELNLPTAELATALLSEVGFDQRLVGIKMAAMGGANPSSLHSMREAANFLHLGEYEMLMRDQNKATVGYIDPAALARWTAGVFGDQELASAIEEIWADSENYGQAVLPIKELLHARLAQCDQVLNPPAEDEAPEAVGAEIEA